jgi:hypothetical protein
MKCRYTLAASAEFDESVSYLLRHAPHVGGSLLTVSTLRSASFWNTHTPHSKPH